MASINNSLFSFLITTTGNNIGDTGATSLSEALKSNTTLGELNLWGDDKRKKTYKWHPSTIHSFHFSLHQQTTTLEKREQHHWVNHWNQTQHSVYSIWVVKTKEDTQMTSINKPLFSFLIIQTGNNIGETGAASLSEALKSNTTLTELNLSCEDKRKKTHKWHPSSIHFFISHNTNRQQDRRHRSKVIEWSIEIKHYTHCTRSELWRQKKEHTQMTSINNSLFSFLITPTDK